MDDPILERHRAKRKARQLARRTSRNERAEDRNWENGFKAFFVILFLAGIGGGYFLQVSGCLEKRELAKQGAMEERRLERENEIPVVLNNSPWDASVLVIQRYLKREYLNDPKSYEGIEWSPVMKLSDGSYQVRHKYRARNSFGGMVVENRIFVYDAGGNVIRVH